MYLDSGMIFDKVFYKLNYSHCLFPSKLLLYLARLQAISMQAIPVLVVMLELCFISQKKSEQ